MKVNKTLTSSDTIRAISEQEFELVKKVLNTNLGFSESDTVVIVTDTAKLEQEAALWFESIKKLFGEQSAPQLTVFVLEGMTASGQEPPSEVVHACEAADLVILHTTFSLTHTQAGKAAARNQGRGASLPGVDEALMMRTVPTDYQSIHTLGQDIQTLLESGMTIHITSPAGTDLTAKIRKQAIYNDSGIISAGSIGNLPAGEVFFAPVLGSATGTWVIDGSLADESDLDAPVTLTIENGIATQISGGKAAERLQKKLQAVGDEAFTVAEIGIGTNPIADPKGALIEAEKAYGTSHLALGNSSAIGGEINVPIHLDGVCLAPTITIDAQPILTKGAFVFKTHHHPIA